MSTDMADEGQKQSQTAGVAVEAVRLEPVPQPVHVEPAVILHAARWRRAIKRYNGQPIPAEDWDFLLEMARLAPTSMGKEAWNLLDITNDRLLRRLDEAAWGIGDKYPGLAHLAVFTVKNGLTPDSPYFQATARAQGYSPEAWAAIVARTADFQANDQDLTDERKRHDWAAKQVYIVFTQMMVAASLIGVDSTPIEGFPQQRVSDILAEEGLLDPATDSLALMAAFGYRDQSVPLRPKTRRPLDQVVRRVE